MDFTTTHEQDLLRDTARQLLANECPPALLRAHLDDRAASAGLWTHLRDFTGLATGPATDLALVLFETGYVAAPGPFFPTVALFGSLLAACGHPLLADVVEAGASGTVAIADATGRIEPHDAPVKSFVVDADIVEHVAVVDPGPTVRVIARADLDVRVVPTVDASRRVAEVTVPDRDGLSSPLAPRDLDGWRDRATVALAAEMVGTARRIFDMALAYAKDRHQFGVPIGSFQAIQHKLAEMALVLERATAAVQYAAMTVDADDPDRRRAAHVAKAAAGAAARRMVKDGAQIHGGIGYTWEHDLHLFLRRATADEYLFGTTGWHHDRLAEILFAS
ncbi:MAG TPA: acyl-CoA dehydrogenase [Acidimicrobiia bacterium]|nr:acyl-CoA dehydrogenase [Acidimicrobiia bacterium]